MNFQLSLDGRRHISRQIYAGLRSAILSGALRAGALLPSTRELATHLRVSRKSVLQAYDWLRSESLIEGKTGSGTRVSASIVPNGGRVSSKRTPLRPARSWQRILAEDETEAAAIGSAFVLGEPDISSFPFRLWRSLNASASRVSGAAQGGIHSSQGERRLREAICAHVGLTRGVVADPNQVVITRGAQQAFDIVIRTLLTPGDTAAMEDPGYRPFRRLLESYGIRVHACPVDTAGLQVRSLPEQARLVYVTPSHQFPLGVPMSLERKLNLLQWAAAQTACIIEDDYDCEYRFDPRPLEALQSLDRHGVVIYIGTFSKVMVPGIRIGYIVAPEPLIPALTAARGLTDGHESVVTQMALTRFILEGHLRAHVRRMSKIYDQRRNTFAKCLREHAPVFGELLPSVAGLHFTCVQETRARTDTLLRRARRAGFALTDVTQFCVNSHCNAVCFGYGSTPEREIQRVLKRIVAL